MKNFQCLSTEFKESNAIKNLLFIIALLIATFHFSPGN